MYKLSIIIPVYKVENYITECLESILEQITPEIQIICINDGTPDESMSIAKNLISIYSTAIQKQFVFVDQRNQGLSVARNTGINIANGSYIGFVDSDDKVMPNYFNILLEKINLNTYDIIDFNIASSNRDIIRTRIGEYNSIDSVFRASAWYSPARIVRKDLMTKYEFYKNIYYEDLALTPLLYIESENASTGHIPQPLYWYRINQEGITLLSSDENNRKTIDSLAIIVQQYVQLYENIGNPYIGIIAIQSYFLLCINACKKIGFKKSLFYVRKFQDPIYNIHTNLISKPENYDILNFRIKKFNKYPKTYLLLYSIYCKIR